MDKNQSELGTKFQLPNEIKSRLSEICDNNLLSKVVADMESHNENLVVENGKVYWDATQYLDGETNSTQDEKAKFVYALAMSGINVNIILDDKQYYGDANVISVLIRTQRVSPEIAEYLIDFGVQTAHGWQGVIK